MKRLIKIIFLLTFLMVVGKSFSQAWPKYYSHANMYDYSDDIIETYDKGYLICGNYNTYDGNEFKQWSWLIKTDINGNVIWNKIIEGGDEFIRTIAIDQTNDGSILTCGLVYTDSGKTDPFVMKLNPCGEKEWCTIFASSIKDNPWAQDIKETPSGEIVVLINQYGEDNVEDMHLAKLNAQGELLWMETYCSGSVYTQGALPYGSSLFITSNNDFLIAGDVYWEDPWNPGGTMALRPLFVSIESLGIEKWVLPFGINDTIYGGGMSILEDVEHFIGIGYFRPDQGYNEGLVMKFDILGNEIGFNKINAKDIDSSFNRVLFYNAYRVDTTFVFGGVMGVETSGNPAMEAISDTNILNNIAFYNSLQHSDLITPYSLAITQNKILSNSTYKETGNWDITLSKLNLNMEYDTLDPGTYTYDSLCIPGPPQSGFIYLNNCNLITGMPSPKEYYADLQKIPVKAYPNPVTKGTITFEYENTGHHNNIMLKCFDIYGEEVHTEKVYRYQGESIVNVGSWPKGMYVAVVYSDGLPAGQCKFVVN